MDFQDRTFEGGTVELDGNRFTNCTFRNVTLKYAGKAIEMADCRMEAFSFQFDGDLAQGLFTLYQLFGTEGMLRIIRGFTEPGQGGTIALPPRG
jgi:hypothetical protein